MERGGRLPGDQAEIVFSDAFVEQLAELSTEQQEEVLATVVALCENPGGKHPLSAPLAGWNTVEVLQRNGRVVYKARDVEGTGLIEVLCIGPKSNDEVYDIALGLAATGVLTDDEVTQLWDALAILDVVAETVGIHGWDYAPPPAPPGMIRAVVAAGVLDQATAELLSKPEVEAALAEGWGEDGPDPEAAIAAVLELARSRLTSTPDPPDLMITQRRSPRCGAWMPRAQARCIRPADHPGAHRAT